jgi:hypothetical protein
MCFHRDLRGSCLGLLVLLFAVSDAEQYSQHELVVEVVQKTRHRRLRLYDQSADLWRDWPEIQPRSQFLDKQPAGVDQEEFEVAETEGYAYGLDSDYSSSDDEHYKEIYKKMKSKKKNKDPKGIKGKKGRPPPPPPKGKGIPKDTPSGMRGGKGKSGKKKGRPPSLSRSSKKKLGKGGPKRTPCPSSSTLSPTFSESFIPTAGKCSVCATFAV